MQSMQMCSSWAFTVMMLVAFAGPAAADGDRGAAGREWDDSHMRTRHQPAGKFSRAETTIVLEIATDGVRTLPATESRSWQSGPNVPVSAGPVASSRRGTESLRPSRTKFSRESRANNRRSQSQSSRSIR